MKKISIPAIFLLFLFLVACESGGGSGESGGGSSGGVADSVQKFSSSDYDALSSEQKYAVSNKLAATLFKGVPVDEFYDIGPDTGAEFTATSNLNKIAEIEEKLSESLNNEDEILFRIDNTYVFDSRAESLQYPLAMLFEYPLSREYFEIWMAYILSNTIFFSPAVELETVDYTDIQDIFYRLVNMIGEGSTIRQIVYEHMISQENWRRFRSPEDNTREMMEIFLRRFEDSEVPLAAAACKNWSLTDDSEGYQLVIGFDENTQPVDILDTTVVDCYDFYQAVADHNDLIPAITAALVDIFFDGYPDEKKEQITGEIISSNPLTFMDLFSTILFSKEYLLNASRPQKFEETFFNIAHRIGWFAPGNFFRNINPRNTSSSFPSQYNMKQAPLTYKLGQPAAVPLDTLSFSYFHKAVREKLLLDRKTDDFNNNDGGWQSSFVEVNYEGDDFINYLFLSVLSRKPYPEELDELNRIIASRGYDKSERHMHQAMIILDYFSRLSELYYFQPIN
jgi:hypothetical protein